MTAGRQPRVNEEINWVTDEDNNVLGFMKDARTFVPIPTIENDPLTGGNDIVVGASTLKLPAGVVDLTGGMGGGGGVPSAFTSRSLTAGDLGAVLVCASAQIATVNTGLAAGFGCKFKGPITTTGSATVTDERTSGAAFQWCELVNTGTDAYSLVGGKA